MLLAEDLLLLLTDDTSGRLAVPAAEADVGLGGAVLAELALKGKVDLAGTAGAGRPGRLAVRDTAPAGDDVLDTALGIVISHQGRKPSAVIRPLGKNLRQALYKRLAASGVIRAEQDRILGVFPARRWPSLDASHKERLRQQLTTALTNQAAPETHSAALIAILHALNREYKIIDSRQSGLSRRQLRARAGEIAAGDWVSAAVRRVIEQTIAAVIAATSAAGAAGAG